MHQQLARVSPIRAIALILSLTVVVVSSVRANAADWNVSPASAHLIGRHDRMRITVSSSKAGEQDDVTRSVEYTSSADSIASVSPEGEVTPRGNGEAKISVKNGDSVQQVKILVSEFDDTAVSF